MLTVIRTEADVPVIGAVNGPALIHAEIPLLADVVLAADTTVFADKTHFTRGSVPGDGVHLIWPYLLGPRRGKYFLMTAQEIASGRTRRLCFDRRVGGVRSAPAGDFDYEANGSGYAARRQPEPRIAAVLHAALGDARTVINVGAGAGSYEPSDRYVVAVEPSAAMRAQRPRQLAPALDATAERLPFDDDSFDAAMATITIHQWSDVDAGLRELRRVSRGPVAILTFDREALLEFWLNEYVPEVIATERARFPAIDHVVDVLGGEVEVLAVPIPIDCADGFGEAYYARPEAFLAHEVRAAQSGWVLTDPDAVARGIARLADDLASGRWDERHGHLRDQPAHVGAVRMIVAR